MTALLKTVKGVIGRKSGKLLQFPPSWRERVARGLGERLVTDYEPETMVAQLPAQQGHRHLSLLLPLTCLSDKHHGHKFFLNAPSKYSFQSPSWPLVQSFTKLKGMNTETNSLLVTIQDSKSSTL